MSVEEAYEKAYRRPSSENIRAAMLAVLDAEHKRGGYPQGCNCITWEDGDRCRRYKTMRRRIEAGAD